MFMFLPSTLDRKEVIQQYNDNVNLHPVDVSYEELKQMNNNKDINPSELENSALRKDIVKVFYNIMKWVAGTSNIIWLEIRMLICLKEEKLTQIFHFLGLIILIKKHKKNVNWGINF